MNVYLYLSIVLLVIMMVFSIIVWTACIFKFLGLVISNLKINYRSKKKRFTNDNLRKALNEQYEKNDQDIRLLCESISQRDDLTEILNASPYLSYQYSRFIKNR